MVQHIREWMLTYENFTGLNGTVPCSLYSILYENHMIEDPFYGLNEYKARELCEKGCTFTAVFDVEEEMLHNEKLLLRFEGVDTLAEIYINGKWIGSTKNMHRIWEFDVKDHLVQGSNAIEVQIHSPMQAAREAASKYPLWGVTHTTVDGYQHIRKAHYMYGWDWGPQLPDMGIFRDVQLIGYRTARILDVWVRQTHLSDGKVRLHIIPEIDALAPVDVHTIVLSPDGERIVDTFKSSPDILIEHPQLWWPNGWGSQPLYTVTVEVVDKDALCCDSKSIRVGLRTLTVSTAADSYGNEFCFVVNGHKLFAMGADYIPEDNFLSRVTKQRTNDLLNDCIRANYNCIRVWGGGYYPDDWFFDLCDELGLIVWQDFMFACATYRMSASFEANLIPEFIENMKRIRNHASLGLLCGNNEMETAWLNWGIPQNERTKLDYLYLYEQLLPDLCEQYAPDTFYWPSSPSSGGGFDDPADENRGDMHCWEVWHGGKPFTYFRDTYFRFCSEFGFESFPDIKTCESFATAKDMNPFSRVMESHQKCVGGNQKMLHYLSEDYLYPKDFKMLVYTSQLLQADAMRHAIEHWRANRGRCMGALYWQVNDCWPVASWASIDSFGRWKALHYEAKRFFAPILLAAFEQDYSVMLALSNETLHDAKCHIRWSVRNNVFETIVQGEQDVICPALSSVKLPALDLTESVKDAKYNRFFVYELYDENGKLLTKRSSLFVKPKHFEWIKPTITADLRQENDEMTITLSTDTFAKGVFVRFQNTDVVLSDNFVDLVDDQPVVLKVEKWLGGNAASLEDMKQGIEICCIADIGE